MLAVAGAQGDAFYFFSGAKLHAGPDGKPVREFLRDAYRFTPGAGWTRLPDLPRAAVAAPTPALSVGDELLVLSGDDGTKVDFQPLREHPGFPRDVLAFDTKQNTWSSRGSVPFSRATVPIVSWRGRFVVPNGEVRPRERTPVVWWAR
jgi:N-acetylneuraminic acid mutarotase